jgi:hypothetical protein
MSRDLGQTWVEEVRLTDALNWSCNPSLASDGNYLHLFWFDLRDDPNNIVGEIYYKRKDLSSMVDEKLVHSLPTAFVLDVYPNPFHEWIELRYRPKKEGIRVRMYDVTGKEVAYSVMKNNPGNMKMVAEGLSCGVYLVKLKAEDGSSVVKKVIKVD